VQIEKTHGKHLPVEGDAAPVPRHATEWKIAIQKKDFQRPACSETGITRTRRDGVPNEAEDRQDIAIDVAFPIDAAERAKLAKAFGLAHAPEGPIAAAIWTTTPWTIPANQALNLHPDLTYALVATDNGHFVVAEDLVAACLARWKIPGSAIATARRGARADPLSPPVLRPRVAVTWRAWRSSRAPASCTARPRTASTTACRAAATA
jgi:isoleucyl-tRNA synthetase